MEPLTKHSSEKIAIAAKHLYVVTLLTTMMILIHVTATVFLHLTSPEVAAAVVMLVKIIITTSVKTKLSISV